MTSTGHIDARARRPHAAHVPRRRPGASPTRSARRRRESSRGERWGGHLPHPYPPAHPQARVRARRGHRERRRDHHHQVRSRHRRGRQVRRRRRSTLCTCRSFPSARRGGGDGTKPSLSGSRVAETSGMTPASHRDPSPRRGPTRCFVPDTDPLVRGLTLVRPFPSSIDPRPPPPPVPNRPRQQGERDVRQRAGPRPPVKPTSAGDGDARLRASASTASTPTSHPDDIRHRPPAMPNSDGVETGDEGYQVRHKAQLGVAKEFTQRAKKSDARHRAPIADSANAVDAAVAIPRAEMDTASNAAEACAPRHPEGWSRWARWKPRAPRGGGLLLPRARRADGKWKTRPPKRGKSRLQISPPRARSRDSCRDVDSPWSSSCKRSPRW